MAERYSRTKVDTRNNRSSSVSDVNKLDALSSLRLESEASKDKRNNSEIHIQELNGVFLKRYPFVEPQFDTNTTIPSFQYSVENKRHYSVRVVMTFSGDNTKVTPGHSSKLIAPLTVETTLHTGETTTITHVDAKDKSRDFNFSADVKVFPIQDEIKETDLQGVHLYTTIDYDDTTSIMKFEAFNSRDFDVEVILEVKGDVREKSSSLPFKKIIRSFEKEKIGYIKSDSEVETHWKWNSLSNAPSNEKQPVVQTAELKGVKLHQLVTSGDPTTIQFDVENTRDKKIRIEIDLTGDGYIDFGSNPRPLVTVCKAHDRVTAGRVNIRGDVDVNWKYKEED